MSDPSNPIGDLPPPRPSSRRSRRRRSSGGPLPLGLVVLGLLLLAGGVWWWFGLRDGGELEAPLAAADTIADDDAGVAPVPVEPLELPELAESDGFIRRVVQGLTAHPRWAEWLVTDRLVERFVTTVASVAAGTSPRSHLPFLVPEERFVVRDSEGRLLVDPAAWRRYDALTETFVSIDGEGAVRLYRQLHPLFDEAYAELGFPTDSFDADVARAIDNLLAVQVPEGDVEVIQGVETYEYLDPAMEGRTPAEKHILRLGPDNARRVQEKLRELRAALVAAGAIPARG